MKTTPIRAIRARCLECAGARKRVRECARGPESSIPCPLWLFRMGRNPARIGIGRALTSESARSMKKRTSQEDGSARNFVRPGEGAGKSRSPVLAVPCASRVQVDPRLSPAEIMSATLLRGLSGGGK